MLEDSNTYIKIIYLIKLLKDIPFFWLILIALVVTLVENVFPPSPSDVILVAIAIIVGMTEQPIIPIVVSSTVGSTLGFWIMFSFGRKFDKKIIETNRIKFLSQSSIEKVENLFKKWGFKLVVVNRFMSGTRAIVSFFAGMTGLPLTKTIVLAGISSFLWYGILSMAGYYFGNDWKTLVEYLRIYDKVAVLLVIFIAVFATIFWFVSQRRKKSET